MKNKLIFSAIGLMMVSGCLVGCGNDNNSSTPVTYKVSSSSETLTITAVSTIQKGTDLTFEVALTSASMNAKMILPIEATTEIKSGNFTLNAANYVYNPDYDNNKATFLVPSAFITGDVTLNIEAAILPDASIKLESNGTPLKLSFDDQPIIGMDYINILEIDSQAQGRFALPKSIVITCNDGDSTYNLTYGQYVYDSETGQFMIKDGYVAGELTVIASAVNLDSVKVNIYLSCNDTFTYEEDSFSPIKYMKENAMFYIYPRDASTEIKQAMDLLVFVNGKPRTYSLIVENSRKGEISIGGIIDGDIVVIGNAPRKKCARLYLSDGAEASQSIIATVNPDLYLYKDFCVYLSPVNPDTYKLPSTLLVEVYDDESGQKLVLTTDDYFYDPNTGLFRTKNPDKVLDIFWITGACITK